MAVQEARHSVIFILLKHSFYLIFCPCSLSARFMVNMRRDVKMVENDDWILLAWKESIKVKRIWGQTIVLTFFFQAILHWSAFLLAFECAHAALTVPEKKSKNKWREQSPAPFKTKSRQNFWKRKVPIDYCQSCNTFECRNSSGIIRICWFLSWFPSNLWAVCICFARTKQVRRKEKWKWIHELESQWIWFTDLFVDKKAQLNVYVIELIWFLYLFSFLGERMDIFTMASNKIDVDKLNRSQTQLIDTPNSRKKKTKCIKFDTNITNCIHNRNI